MIILIAMNYDNVNVDENNNDECDNDDSMTKTIIINDDGD